MTWRTATRNTRRSERGHDIDWDRFQREFRAYADERETCDRPRASHGGRRSGDQFCVHIADHYVLPELTREQIAAIRDSRLSSG